MKWGDLKAGIRAPFDFIGDNVIKPLGKEVVRPLIRDTRSALSFTASQVDKVTSLPGQAVKSLDGLFLPLAIGGAAVLIAMSRR